MKREYFFISALLTALLFRSMLYFSRFFIPETHIMVYGQIIHHFWLGIPFLVAAFIVSRKYKAARAILWGIGFGPIADELIFMLIGGGGYSHYWAMPSVVGMVACVIVLFIFRNKIARLVAN